MPFFCYMLPNWCFHRAYAFIKKTISVGNYDCSFKTENLKIQKYFLLKDYVGTLNAKFQVHFSKKYTTRQMTKKINISCFHKYIADFHVAFEVKELKVRKSDITEIGYEIDTTCLDVLYILFCDLSNGMISFS